MSNGGIQINGQSLGEYLRFERNATPFLIHVAFWGGLTYIVYRSYLMIDRRPFGSDEYILYAIFYLVFASAVWRILCELARSLIERSEPAGAAMNLPAAPQPVTGTFPINAAQPSVTAQPVQPAGAAPEVPQTSAVESASTFVFCTQCGMQSESGKKFCTGCGAGLPQTVAR